MNVFHHHNGVIHQNTDRKYQRKQGDPVQSISQQIGYQERQSQRRRHRHADNPSFSPAQGKADQQHYGYRRNQHMLQQLIGLFLRRLSIITRNRPLHIKRQYLAVESFQFRQGPFGNHCRIGAFLLGYRQSHRLIGSISCLQLGGAPSGLIHKYVLLRFSRAICNRSDLL